MQIVIALVLVMGLGCGFCAWLMSKDYDDMGGM